MRAVRSGARFVGPGVDEGRRIGVVDFECRRRRCHAARDGPDAAVAICGHDVEHRQLALEHLVVGRQHIFLPRNLITADVARVALDERQERPFAVRRVPVGHPVPVEPQRVPVDNRLAQPGKEGRARCGRRPEKIAVDDLGDAAVALGVQVHAVRRERRFRVEVRLPRRREEIDETYTASRGDIRHRPRVQRQPLVVRPAIRQIRVVQILVRDGGEQHDARRGLPVVLLPERVGDPVVERLLECVEAGRPRVGFVVAEEREDDVGFRSTPANRFSV